MSAAKKKSPPSQETNEPLRLTGILLLMLAGMLLVLGARANSGEVLRLSDLIPYVLWTLSAVGLALFLRLGRYQGAPVLPELVLMLSAVGVLVRSRMEGQVEGIGGWTQLIQPLGFVWMWLTWAFTRNGRVKLLRPLWPLAFLLSIGVIGGLVLLGNSFRGAFYGPGGLTPSELLKLFVPLALAGFFASQAERWKGKGFWNPPFGPFVLLAAGWVLLCGLLVWQRDLGLMLLLSLMLVLVLITATRSLSWGVLLVAATAGAGWLVFNTMAHGARRLQAWVDPFADPTGSGWQVLQGLSGLYAGGLTGTGLGAGRPDRLPIAGSDFVYAVYGEELGYLGCLLLLLLFGQLLRRCTAVANLQHEEFAALLATGLTGILAVQVIVNIAGVVTLLPITGITLPYISQGGSSIWVTSVQFGLLLGMSEPGKAPKSKKKTTKKAPKKKKR